ncbi:MAG: hypothetical protein R3C02_23930 [Planctomycetaceae bacterium]
MFPVNHSPVDRHPRAGYSYLGVMMTALIVGLVGVSALVDARQADTAQRQNDLFSAQTLARTAIEDAVRQIND